MEKDYLEILYNFRKRKEHDYAQKNENKTETEIMSSDEEDFENSESDYEPNENESSSSSTDSSAEIIYKKSKNSDFKSNVSQEQNHAPCTSVRVDNYDQTEQQNRENGIFQNVEQISIESDEQLDIVVNTENPPDYQLAVTVDNAATETQGNDDTSFDRIINCEIPFEIISGKQYNSKLLWSSNEKQFYLKNTSSKIGIGYTCYSNNCTARVHLRDDKCFIANSDEHQHTNEEQLFINLTALNEIRNILTSVENNSSPKVVFNTVVAK